MLQISSSMTWLLVPGFYINLISGDELEERGYWVNCFNHPLRFSTDDPNVTVKNLQKMHGLPVADSRPITSSTIYPSTPMQAFSTIEAPQPRRDVPPGSQMPLPVRQDAALAWHLRAGHAGPDVMDRLNLQTRGVRITGPTPINCPDCA